LYFNVEHIRQVVWQRLRAATEPVRLVICDLSTSPYVDVAGARMLAGLYTDLSAVGLQFQLLEAHAAVRDILRAEGLEARVGRISRSLSLDDIIEAAHQPPEPHSLTS
jgi:anti-anti-sigma regulatory factor